MTACSPAVFHPAPTQEAAAEPTLVEHAEQVAPTEQAEQPREAEQDAAPLPALASEVKSARESQREAAAEGASALEAAHRQHQEELAAEEARLAAEQAEVEAEIERQRLEDQAAQEASQHQDGSTEEREDDAAAEAPTEQDAPAEPAPEDTGEEDAGEEDPAEEGAGPEEILGDDAVEEDPAPSAPSPEEPSPEESEPVQPEAPTEAPSFTGDLDDYLDELAAHYPGDISVSVAELDGQGRTGSTAGGESRVSASTYKVFVAYGILDQVESGELDWDDPIDGGRDRAACFADMISVSDNPCADVFREELGWEGLRDIAAETGGPATDFIPAYARTSANDLSGFMTRLESGTLDISEESRSRLLGALESNIFREGIGAGSTGTVLNKVGFIDGHLNDTAIVRHPEGSYVLSIMSEGSDWTAIASITKDIEAALY